MGNENQTNAKPIDPSAPLAAPLLQVATMRCKSLDDAKSIVGKFGYPIAWRDMLSQVIFDLRQYPKDKRREVLRSFRTIAGLTQEN